MKGFSASITFYQRSANSSLPTSIDFFLCNSSVRASSGYGVLRFLRKSAGVSACRLSNWSRKCLAAMIISVSYALSKASVKTIFAKAMFWDLPQSGSMLISVRSTSQHLYIARRWHSWQVALSFLSQTSLFYLLWTVLRFQNQRMYLQKEYLKGSLINNKA